MALIRVEYYIILFKNKKEIDNLLILIGSCFNRPSSIHCCGRIFLKMVSKTRCLNFDRVVKRSRAK